MQKINVLEFKAVCLRLLEDVKQSGEPIEIIKNGQPLAIVYPAPSINKNSFGILKNSLTSEPYYLITPIKDFSWEALK